LHAAQVAVVLQLTRACCGQVVLDCNDANVGFYEKVRWRLMMVLLLLLLLKMLLLMMMMMPAPECFTDRFCPKREPNGPILLIKP
jgi:hypothetical protein